MPRPRALAVATGMPVLFALLAAGLGVAPQAPTAQAGEAVEPVVVAADAVSAAEAVSAPVAVSPYAVTRADPRVGYRPIPVLHRVPTNDEVAFITIDDGVHKNRDALAYVLAHRLPVTAFLSTWTIKDRARYFTQLTTWGSIQNHSATHASFAAADTDLGHEICYAQKAIRHAFGTASWMLRPPYGEGADRFGTVMTAKRCDIRQLVLWDTTVQEGRVRFANGRLRPGSILLLHFSKDLDRDLKAAVRAIREAGLTPADLAQYLPAS